MYIKLLVRYIRCEYSAGRCTEPLALEPLRLISPSTTDARTAKGLCGKVVDNFSREFCFKIWFIVEKTNTSSMIAYYSISNVLV